MKNRRMDKTVLLLCFYCLLSECFGRDEQKYWNVEAYPNPMIDVSACGLPEPAFVCDPNNQLKGNQTKSGIHIVSDFLKSVKRETVCSCPWNETNGGLIPICDLPEQTGYTISVAIVKYMSLPMHRENNGQILDEYAANFATQLRRRWHFGQCDDDAVIFVSTGDEKVFTSVGKQMGRVLTDSVIRSITRNALPDFPRGSITEGVVKMIRSYKEALRGQPLDLNNDPNLFLPFWLLIIIAILLGIVLVILIVVICKFCRTKKSHYEMASQNP